MIGPTDLLHPSQNSLFLKKITIAENIYMNIPFNEFYPNLTKNVKGNWKNYLNTQARYDHCCVNFRKIQANS
jgi:hypothetical protein